jgi:hypothetical protein
MYLIRERVIAAENGGEPGGPSAKFCTQAVNGVKEEQALLRHIGPEATYVCDGL